MKNDEFKKKKNIKPKKLLFSLIVLAVIIVFVLLVVIFYPNKKNSSFFSFPKQTQTQDLSVKFELKVIKKLLVFVKEKKFIKNFDIIFFLSSWLSESELKLNKEMRFLFNVKNSFKNFPKKVTPNEKEIIKVLRKELISYKYFYGSLNRLEKALLISTKEEKENKFISSFQNLFIFCFLQEKGTEDDLFFKKNEEILLFYITNVFLFLPKESQKNMWKKFSMNIITLLTPISEKWIDKMYQLSLFSLKEEKNFLETLRKNFFSLATKEKKEEMRDCLKIVKRNKCFWRCHKKSY